MNTVRNNANRIPATGRSGCFPAVPYPPGGDTMAVHPGRGENPSLAESLISAEAEHTELLHRTRIQDL